MSHHPLGVYSQRRNVGWTRQDGSHTISSLPGSSGAGIFTLRNFLGCIGSVFTSKGKCSPVITKEVLTRLHKTAVTPPKRKVVKADQQTDVIYFEGDE